LREVADRETWDSALVALGGSVMQSYGWGEFRRHHGWRPVRLLDRDRGAACQVLLRDLPGIGSLAYAPHGPVCAAEDLDGVTSGVADRARDLGAFTLEVEPRAPEGAGVGAAGFLKSASSVQPRCTLVVDVLESAEEQLRSLPKDTRYGVRRAGREGIEAGPSQNRDGDLEDFLSLLEETAGRQGFAVRPREYYRRFLRELPAHLVVAHKDGVLLAGAVLLTFGEEAYYLYGASAREGDNLYASYLVQYEALSVVRDHGARRYDMWGIPCEPHENHPLWGVYGFKRKFGGREERYAGAYEKRLRPVRAALARTALKGYYAAQKFRGRTSGPISD
jgi:lipid II:glycine glycyltransferase (peptidoglycan interpeptide bridge formation enzyme)